MSPIGIAVLAVSMSVDAFAVSVGRGAAIGRPRFAEALRTGVVFGLVEALTPVLGWAAGVAASQYVAAVDHWIAFALLAGVGLHMLWNARGGRDEAAAAPTSHSLLILIATAVGTSLDAMAVGVSLAFLNVNIVVIAAAIGLTTFLMSSGGMLLGRLIGARLGRLAEILAGIALFAIGAMILVEHLALLG
ncbi:manganese efflux pump MntP family protein [Acuticoccus kandeliae]|uniref:manganese efflux pump MntP n=1 Tax=Acuticoccus kandeliae TaxID=2073160 RepID=UPI000D3ED51A|nr:manganese efflux pump MntP family protein [Acuticoccus kandeliae]